MKVYECMFLRIFKPLAPLASRARLCACTQKLCYQLNAYIHTLSLTATDAPHILIANYAVTQLRQPNEGHDVIYKRALLRKRHACRQSRLSTEQKVLLHCAIP